MKRWPIIAAVVLLSVSAPLRAELHAVIVEGLGGDDSYAAQFDEQVAAIEAAMRTLTSGERIRTFAGQDATRDAIIDYFGILAANAAADDQVMVYLVGHGSYDDVEYKFNIPGPDLSAADIAGALDALPDRSQLLVNTSSASGATLDMLERDGRVIITATRSGVERHATRFGTYFAASLNDEGADLDKNRMITADEAFRYAERRVTDFFEGDNRLATEHARLVGDLAGRVTVARLDTSRPRVTDEQLAELMTQRDALNVEVESLRQARDGMAADDYRAQLLEKMLELAQLEERIEERQRALDGDD